MHSWYLFLPWWAKFGIGVACLPLVFLGVGMLIFMMEPPGESFWGDQKPTLWRCALGTMTIGAVGSLILAAIFGVNALLSEFLILLGQGSAAFSPLTFILALILVVGGIAWWFEGRNLPS